MHEIHERIVKSLRSCMRLEEPEFECIEMNGGCCDSIGRCTPHLMDKAADAIEVLSKKENTTQWIPVTERLPEPYMRDTQGRIVHYLVMLMDENLILIASRTDKCWIYRGDGSRLKGVTHWMPLPEPPKEE